MSLLTRILVWALIVAAPVGGAQATTVDFTLPDIEGKAHRLADYRGKWVVVNYWATWCPPCLEELSELELFHNNRKAKDAVVVGVNMEDIGSERLKRFVQQRFISYPILRSKPGDSTPFGRISGLPTTFIVSPSGEVVARQVGPITAAALDNYLESKRRGDSQ